MAGKEIEIKLQLEADEYCRLVEALNSTVNFKTEKHQIDVYYSPKEKSFYDDGDRCLRMRIEGKSSILSYKQIHNENTEKQFIEEYETSIENPEIMDCILKALEYRKEIVVDKKRLEYYLNEGFLVAIDKVENLGFFVEIENHNEADTLENRNRSLVSFINKFKLDITRRNTEGYSNMMFRKKIKNGETK